jgi:hypothetical protein
MNLRELAVKRHLEDNGWNVLRRGWPDLLAFREVDGKLEVRGIEVKAGPADELSNYQKTVHAIFNRVGIPTNVYWADPGLKTVRVILRDGSDEKLRDTVPAHRFLETCEKHYEKVGVSIPRDNLDMRWIGDPRRDPVVEAGVNLCTAQSLLLADRTPENKKAVEDAEAKLAEAYKEKVRKEG